MARIGERTLVEFERSGNHGAKLKEPSPAGFG
jgi:hypothetical protein